MLSTLVARFSCDYALLARSFELLCIFLFFFFVIVLCSLSVFFSRFFVAFLVGDIFLFSRVQPKNVQQGMDGFGSHVDQHPNTAGGSSANLE